MELVFEREVDDVAEFADADLIVGADGINSKTRNRYAAHFKPTVQVAQNRFVWLGTHRVFEAFTFIFVQTEFGWFQAHAYRFNARYLDLHRRNHRCELARGGPGPARYCRHDRLLRTPVRALAGRHTRCWRT